MMYSVTYMSPGLGFGRGKKYFCRDSGKTGKNWGKLVKIGKTVLTHAIQYNYLVMT